MTAPTTSPRRARPWRSSSARDPIIEVIADRHNVADLYAQLRDVAAAHLPELDVARAQDLGTDDDEGVEQVGRELLRRAEAGEVVVVVLDIRRWPEFAVGHSRGAVSIPLDEFPKRLSELPVDVEVVAYCRDTYCVFAHKGRAAAQARDDERPASPKGCSRGARPAGRPSPDLAG
jgi:Rhodanese-like domain